MAALSVSAGRVRDSDFRVAGRDVVRELFAAYPDDKHQSMAWAVSDAGRELHNLRLAGKITQFRGRETT